MNDCIIKEEYNCIDDDNNATFYTSILNHIMDGTLQLLWHEEIKKDIPKPQIMVCMLSK